MRIALYLSFVIVTLAPSFSMGQEYIIPDINATPVLSGAARNPPIFSQMTVLMQGDLNYENTFDIKGSVASIERIDERRLNQRPNSSSTKVTLEFDKSHHLTKRISESGTYSTTEIVTWANGRLEKQESVHRGNDGKTADRSSWYERNYDGSGRLSEVRAGNGKEVTMDIVNFKYDPLGRLLGYELLAQEVFEFSYQGNQITESGLEKYSHAKTYEQTQVVDEKGQVVDLKVSDMTGGSLSLWYHVAFKYDNKGRIIEQRTDPFKLGSGDDYSPMPGKLAVEYNDEKQTGEQQFTDTDGKLMLHTRFAYDRDGGLTKLRVLDSSGNELVGSETFVDADHKRTTRAGAIEWEVMYDDRGNWTERRLWFTPKDGGEKIMTRLIRQTITYRSSPETSQ